MYIITPRLSGHNCSMLPSFPLYISLKAMFCFFPQQILINNFLANVRIQTLDGSMSTNATLICKD